MEYNFDSQEFKSTDMYEKFIKENSARGILKIEAHSSTNAYPLKNVRIVVSKMIENDKVIFFDGLTNESGIIENIILPTKVMTDEVNSAADIIFTTYDVEASYPDNDLKKDYNVSIFDNVKVIQPVVFQLDEIISGDLSARW